MRYLLPIVLLVAALVAAALATVLRLKESKDDVRYRNWKDISAHITTSVYTPPKSSSTSKNPSPHSLVTYYFTLGTDTFTGTEGIYEKILKENDTIAVSYNSADPAENRLKRRIRNGAGTFGKAYIISGVLFVLSLILFVLMKRKKKAAL